MKDNCDDSSKSSKHSDRPLSALFSQILVAYTVELDNEFERRMGESGYAGAGLSLVVWLNLIRFLGDGARSVQELNQLSLAQKERIKHELGCLERWKYIVLRAGPEAGRSKPPATREEAASRRDGWGSGRGIRGDWTVELTAKGQKAAAIWPPSLKEVERRWEERFGPLAIKRLRDLLSALVKQFDFEMPQGLPCGWQLPCNTGVPNRTKSDTDAFALPVLLSRALYAFAIEFDRRSETSLALSANTLRVLGDEPIPVRDIPRLTGASDETSGVGWQLKPYVVIQAGSASTRGKVIRLNQRGLKAQREYIRLAAELEKSWENRFGQERIKRLRDSLQDLFCQSKDGRPLLSEGMSPPAGVRRSGKEAPSLGRKTVGPAARQRMRDLVAQTQAFIADPSKALPHYPLWDMNRGFGP